VPGGCTHVAESTTLRAILECTRSRSRPERSAHAKVSRIKTLLRRPACHQTLALLSSSDLATYRGEQLRSSSPSTVIRALNTISHAIDTPMQHPTTVCAGESEPLQLRLVSC